MVLPRDVPALVAALAMAIGGTSAMPVAAAADTVAPKCSHNNCYNNLFDSRYFASAQSFCPGFLAGTTTAASAIPTAFKNCKDASAVSSACSCVVYTTPATTTSSSSTSTSTSTSSSSTVSASTTAAPTAPLATCNHNNCYLNLVDSRYIATAQSFCPEFLAATTTAASAIPTAFKNCKSDVGKVSSACSCIVGVTTSSSSSTTTPSSTSSTSSGPAGCTAAAGQLIANPGFEDAPYDGSPWLFDSAGGATLQDDSTKAHSGDYYVLVNVLNRDTGIVISQHVSGFDPTHEYTLSYYWGLTDLQQIYDGDCRITTTANGQTIDMLSTKRVNPAYAYFQHSAVFTPPAADLDLVFTFKCGGNYFYGAGFIVDDFSVRQSCPSCTAIDPAPEGASCGLSGYAANYAAQVAGGDPSSLPNCAQSCTAVAGCQSFSFFDGPSHGSVSYCQLYSLPVDQLGFTADQYGYVFNDLACYQCSAPE